MKDVELKIMPLKPLISFDKLLRRYDELSHSENEMMAKHAQEILKAQEPYPELRNGFLDMSLLETHKNVLRIILQDCFPPLLSDNEIKAASLPYDDVFFNTSNRFQKIINEAGPNFKPSIRNQDVGMDYIVGCIVILNFYYGYDLDFRRPFFYDIPDANGVMKHYRILYNADFLEIIPTGKAKEISWEDVQELLDKPNDLALWMDKIPPGSFISKGFVISNMFDVTSEQTISEVKSKLISTDKRGGTNFISELQETFSSFFRLPDITVGFVVYDVKGDQFLPVYGKNVNSVILNGETPKSCDQALCENSYAKLIKEHTYFTISDISKYGEGYDQIDPYKSLKAQGYKSAIFAPITFNGDLLGVLEVTSKTKNVLNGVNAKKLDDIMPYIVAAVVRAKIGEENLIDAIIQNECTSVHSSVYWRFQEEAKLFIKDQLEGKQPFFKEIVFNDIFPLYGQIDIKDSSKARNNAIQRDLMIQLSMINDVLKQVFLMNKLPIYEELMFRVNNHLKGIKEMLHTNSEQAILEFIKDEISPIFSHLIKTGPELHELIFSYTSKIDTDTDSYYDHRRNYDESVMYINKKLAAVIDSKQEEAQAMFPHYFERYKTDGVEHNMYIGGAISEKKPYDPLYLHNLRLWQLQVMCDMENEHYTIKRKLSVPLDTASLILVHNSSLSIRFRLDEKQFDVDGTYNARYEVIKKRIDKSFVKGTNERLTQAGKMAIVYSQKKDELEYLRYIKFLKSKGYFTDFVEIVELEGLQGVSGLKAIRAEILYTSETSDKRTYTYQDLMNTINN